MPSTPQRPEPARPRRLYTMGAFGIAALATVTVLPGCASSLFFRPNGETYVRTDELEFPIDDVWFESEDGTKLHGWWLRATDRPKRGTVVFCHGNNKNVTHHVRYAGWFTRRGFDVLIFDYRGYGKSEGSPTRAGLVSDTLAAIDLALAADPERTVVFGHSLGGALAIVASARRPAVRAIVAESTFGSFRDVARYHAGWLRFLVPLLVPNGLDPESVIADLAPRPVLVIHGAEDTIVPVEQGIALYEKASEPKDLYIARHSGHRSPWTQEGDRFEDRVTDFLLGAIED